MQNIKQQLAGLKNDVPKSARFLFFREKLMGKIAFHQFNEQQNSSITFYVFVKNFFNPRQMAYSAVAVFCLIVIGVGARVIPSYGANPGGPLYNARVMMERMPLVVLSDQGKVTKEVELAKKRQDEVKEILASGARVSDKSKKIESVVKHLARNVEETQKQISELGKNKNAKQKTRAAAAVAKESVADIKKSLEGVKIAVSAGQLTESANVEAQKVSLQIAYAELTTLGILIDTVEGKDSIKVPVENAVKENEPSESEEESVLPQDAAEENESVSNFSAPPTPSAEVSDKTTDKPKEIMMTEVNADQTNEDVFKEEVRHDLEESITALEKAIQDMEAVELEEVSENAENTEDIPENSSLNQEVVLNVSEIIDKEQGARERAKKISDIKSLLAEAKKELANGSFKSAWEFIKDAQKLKESI
ncbi:MAG: hypothetical protein HY564_00700 [Candidatus Jacksonbacteria bacterium]|nr:hypothetical protein [Candidatus Jacksonbacteria bacterium]